MRGEKGGCTMKQGKLIRRAVSAALAGCMMFTLSVPALAESTDALMQLSMTRRSAVSVLDAEMVTQLTMALLSILTEQQKRLMNQTARIFSKIKNSAMILLQTS